MPNVWYVYEIDQCKSLRSPHSCTEARTTQWNDSCSVAVSWIYPKVALFHFIAATVCGRSDTRRQTVWSSHIGGQLEIIYRPNATTESSVITIYTPLGRGVSVGLQSKHKLWFTLFSCYCSRCRSCPCLWRQHWSVWHGRWKPASWGPCACRWPLPHFTTAPLFFSTPWRTCAFPTTPSRSLTTS